MHGFRRGRLVVLVVKFRGGIEDQMQVHKFHRLLKDEFRPSAAPRWRDGLTSVVGREM